VHVTFFKIFTPHTGGWILAWSNHNRYSQRYSLNGTYGQKLRVISLQAACLRINCKVFQSATVIKSVCVHLTIISAKAFLLHTV